MLISLLVWICVWALIWWLVMNYLVPRLAEPFRTIVIIVLVLAVIIWLLNFAGIISPSVFYGPTRTRLP